MPSQGSNINSVKLASGTGEVTITGSVDVPVDYTITLLHVWLAQPGAPEQNGVGVAIDCLDKTGPGKLGPGGKTFELTVAPGNPATGVLGGPFFFGPATVSAIAVLSPKPGKPGATGVLQWSRIVELSQDVDVGESAEGPNKGT
jgi:hypothetical protein